MNSRLVIIGAGGFGRESAWTAETAGFEIAGFCDDDPGAASRCGGARFLGSIEAAAETLSGEGESPRFFVAVGRNPVRRALFARAEAVGWMAAAVVSPRAAVAPGVAIGDGAYVGPGSVVSVGASIGRGAIVNNLASVGHDVSIGEFAQVCPGAAISGGCTICEEALLGTNATVIPLKRIGAKATLGAGALALRDIADGESIVRLR